MVSKQGLREEEEKEEEEKEERGENKAKVWIFVWIHDFCKDIMDSGMILVQELLGSGLLGFHLDINLVPFF